MSEDNQDHQFHPNENLVMAEPDPDPADEAAGSRPERPHTRGVTRRALLGGTALGAGLLAYTSDYERGGVTHSIARAATVPDEPLITVGPEDDPVGYIFESNGDWVFKHEASGNEFFYNSTDDRWETNQELDVPALVTDGLDYNSLTPDYRLARWAHSEEGSNPTTTSTDYTTVLRLHGTVDTTAIPANATLYGRFIVLLSNDGASNTTSARPVFRDGGATTALTELEVSATGTDNEAVDSGWVEITTSLNTIHDQVRFQMKVDAGTGTMFFRPVMFELAGVESVA